MNWLYALLIESQANLRLRTKLLLSLVLSIAGLTSVTLLVVRHTARVQVQTQIEGEARNAILTFQVMQNERQMVLANKADLLATVAHMRGGDATSIQEISQDPWQSDECNLFLLADHRGKIVALQAPTSSPSLPPVQELLRRALKEGARAGWWYTDGRLYQVALQPFYEDAPAKGGLPGTVVVGREVDARVVGDVGRITSSHFVFRYGGDFVISTLSPLQEQEVARQIQGGPAPPQIQIGDEKFFVSSLELTPGMQPAVSLTVLKSYRQAAIFLARLNHLLLGLGLVAVLAGGALVFLISDAFTRPLTWLLGGVRALEEGNFAYHLEAHGADEVAQVTRAFEQMRRTLQNNQAQTQQLEDQLRQAQKMDALGRLAGGVAHDFNNLLTIIKGHCGLLLDRLKPGDSVYASGEQIQKASDRAASLTRQLLTFSRRQMLQPKVLDLNELIAEMGKLLRRLVREDIEFLLQLGESLGRVKGDPGQIEQVLLNLTVNACDAMPQGGKLTIETHNMVVDKEYAKTRPSVEPGDYVMLAVSDTGQGMDAATKARVFEPFFTTKESGKGTGLGLAIVYGVVTQSEGFIWVDSSPRKGTRFEIYLPRVRGKVDRTPSENIAVAPARGFETILLVEDEEEVRELASGFLTSAGYRVITAQDGLEALKIAQRLGETIHLLLTDVVMPNMSGPELVKELKRLLPDLKIVYMSGYIEQNEDCKALLEKEFYLQKPFSRDVLLRQVSEALNNVPFAHARIAAVRR
ncbi:MAG TPA: ATP-binding protein [Candidatus Acidoferrum sp.]|jgi:signal transduction histidine kinase/CheY-like chemotaxis protein|nr:ATP-binding protein [Candidatus Acidoferrum sp.]